MLEPRCHLPSAIAIDAPLLGGVLLVGIGWGLSGWCRGPAIASLSALMAPLGLFLVAVPAGLDAVRALHSGGVTVER